MVVVDTLQIPKEQKISFDKRNEPHDILSTEEMPCCLRVRIALVRNSNLE